MSLFFIPLNKTNTMIIDFNKELIKLNKVRTGQIQEGLKLGLPSLDEHLRFKYGNFNIMLGHANVGKTTTVLYLMLLFSIKHKIRWLVYSSENEAYALIRKLVEFMCGLPINKIDEETMNTKGDFINEHFKFIDTQTPYTYKELLNLAGHIKNAWSYDGFMIDPYNSLNLDRKVLKGISEHNYHYECTTDMRIFCKQNNVSIWLNVHAVTEALRKKHKPTHYYAEHPIPPMASDAEGGGKFVNRADDFFCIHRYTQHPTDWMYSMIHTRKIKDTDTGSRPTPMDEPVRLKSVINNVGFSIDGVNLINKLEYKQQKAPF